ncbi:MAG: tetratricopeptide repeat protein, partial [Pseudomonadota bacterium]|nr:tetratricopeptide repeat protein [Pseudomonadota bacterium]
MAELRTEEEQLEAIKRWWKENGTSLIAGAVLAAAGVFGWNAWQDYQEGQSVAASSSYQQLLDLASRDELSDNALTQAESLVASLREDHGDTLYSELALLMEARLEVAGGDLEAAREALESLIESSDDGYLVGIARLRLARLQSAEGQHDTAL